MILKEVKDVILSFNFGQIADVIRSLLKNWSYTGRTYTFDFTGTKPLTIRHGLGRVPSKVFPVYQGAVSAYYVTSHSEPKNYIIVTFDQDVTATIYID